NPVPHCWSEPGHLKRKFCNVCRRRIEDNYAMRCEVCEYCVHLECQDFCVPDCKECGTYAPSRDHAVVQQYHHWREGNLPGNAKCQVCRKTCWSAECLTGFRCEWCGTTAHPFCYRSLAAECRFGPLEAIMLPPASVSIPRTDVPLETIIGVRRPPPEALARKSLSIQSYGVIKCFTTDSFITEGPCVAARSTSEEFSQQKESDDQSSKEKVEEVIKVYDGNGSLRRKHYRTIVVLRSANKEQLVCACLRAFHISDDPRHYQVTDASGEGGECEIPEESPVTWLMSRVGGRGAPAIFLRFRPPDSEQGHVKVYPGRFRTATDTFRSIPVTSDTTVEDVMAAALSKFGLDVNDIVKYRLSELTLDRGSVHERVMDDQEGPWDILKNTARESIRQKELTRFYIQKKENVRSSIVALFVGNLPPNLSQRQYETVLVELLGKPYKFRQIGPIYYEYGSLIITYDNADIAVKAFYMLRETSYEDKPLLVLLLPSIISDMIPEGVRPLLVFVNVKSGGCQGAELIASFRKLLNPYQVYDLENGGPLPGLYVFRHIRDYKIMVCGGDGTVGWVLQCLDNVGQDSDCQSPPCAIVPLGTGNDLARVLRWGPGYTGTEDPLSLLRDVIEAEEVRLDRWTVVFHADERPQEDNKAAEDNTAIFVMNNYFGIGIDADLCLDFHTAREENPERFNSRLHNKGVYVKMGLRKMVSRKPWRDLHREVVVEMDGRVIDLPQREDDRFSKPTHYDGMLELVGVTGVVHMGQIQSGLRSGIRIAQGGHLRIRINTEMPVQVDGEPWIQGPCEVVVLRSALKATMLRKSKMKRRNTEPALASAASGEE
ncbi:DGKQ, partial [Cordylochernes scorpioides]